MLRILEAIPQELLVVLGICLILAIGLLSHYQHSKNLKESLHFLSEYRNKFITYANSQGADTVAYRWLMLNSQKAQRELGETGMYDAFRPPFERVQYRNYAIILNMLPRVRQMMDDNRTGLWGEQISGYVHAIDEALLRRIGPLTDSLTEFGKRITNPFYLFRSGMEQVLSLPLYALSLFGVIGFQTISLVRQSKLFKFLVGLAGVFSFICALVGFLVDWSQAERIVREFLGK